MASFISSLLFLPRLWLFLVGAFVFFFHIPTAEAQTLNEDPLKAQFILLFKDYFYFEEEIGATFTIGFLSKDVLYQETAKQIENSSQAAAYKLRVVETPEDLDAINLLVVSSETDKRAIEFVKNASKRGVLTVGKSIIDYDYGTIVAFDVVRNRLRFAINFEAAEASNIKPSSRIARLAIQR